MDRISKIIETVTRLDIECSYGGSDEKIGKRTHNRIALWLQVESTIIIHYLLEITNNFVIERFGPVSLHIN